MHQLHVRTWQPQEVVGMALGDEYALYLAVTKLRLRLQVALGVLCNVEEPHAVCIAQRGARNWPGKLHRCDDHVVCYFVCVTVC